MVGAVSPRRSVRILVASLAAVGALSGCSAADLLVWGPDGTRVIQVTDQLIEAAASGEAESLACDDSVADFRVSTTWVSVSVGEPERISEFWQTQVDLGATWSIDLESQPDSLAAGYPLPSDVFYREVDGALCVVDIVWATVAFVSG